MIQEITAKTMLSFVRGDDRIFGMKYNFNIYRGCPHQCIYCDSRSQCYGIEEFRDVLVKINAVELLEKELPRKRVKGPIGTGSMSDPYNPVEERYQLTRRCLEVIARHGFPVHLITKSDLVTRDVDVLAQIARVHAAVCFTITTTDDELARKIEPGAPPPSARLAAMRALAEQGVPVGTTLMPVLPFITDREENIAAVVAETARHGGRFIIPWFGMSLRDRQREWFYTELDKRFPGLRAKYERRYGERYDCPAPNAARLGQVFAQARAKFRLDDHIPYYAPPVTQPGLW
jgi:DNA repair photolyase